MEEEARNREQSQGRAGSGMSGRLVGLWGLMRLFLKSVVWVKFLRIIRVIAGLIRISGLLGLSTTMPDLVTSNIPKHHKQD